MNAEYSRLIGDSIVKRATPGAWVAPSGGNPFTAKRVETLQRLSSADEAQIISHLEARRGELLDYLRTRSGTAVNPAAPIKDLALQVLHTRWKSVQHVARSLSIEPEQALLLVEAHDAKTRSMDNFGGDVFALIQSVTKEAVAAITKDKIANGQDVDGFWRSLAQTIGADLTSAPNANIRDIVTSVIEGIKEREKEKEIRKMLPWILFGLAALVIVTYHIARDSKK